MPANATVGAVNTSTTAFGSNPPYQGIEWRATRNADYHVYLFNISRRTFEKIGRLGRNGMTIAGVEDNDPVQLFDSATKKVVNGKENERYHYVTSLPQPILMAKFNDQENVIDYVETDVIRFVVDMIDPDNLTRSLDTVIAPENRFSIGNNLAEKGVFFSLTNPPTKEDMRAAVKRMETYYNRLLEQAATLELTDKVKLSEQLAGNPDYAYAADYFGKEVSWRKKQVRPVECENCGEQKPAGRRFHVTSFGSLCVEQSVAGWQAAVNSGVKRYDDVPDDFRWKKNAPKSAPTA
jgi:hypothetical protein